MFDSAPPAVASPFQWVGELPLGPHGVQVELSINTYMKGELPDLPPGENLPEVGPLLSLDLEGVEVTFYRYYRIPRGLRALYSNKRMLSVWCAWFQEGGQQYMFRLVVDQVSTRDGALWLRSLVDLMEPAYQAEDLPALLGTPLLETVRDFLQGDQPLRSERRLYLAEVAAEVDGEIHFLHRSEALDSTPVRLRLPAAPGDSVGLAFRLEGAVRQVTKTGVQVVRGKGNKGRVVRLLVPGPEGEEERKARTDSEGWAQFSDVLLESQRCLRFRVGGGGAPGPGTDPQGSLVLRWGRELEANLDRLVPEVGRGRSGSCPAERWRSHLVPDLASSWDPDRGVFRCVTPGQVLPESLEALSVVRDLEEDAGWARDFLEEVPRRAGARRSELPVFLRYACGGLTPRTLVERLGRRLADLDQEDPAIWTEERAKLVQEMALAQQWRPQKRLAELLRRAAESLAYRLDAEPEPTWRYQAHGRPPKTFKANPDIALPHAEAVLALLAAEAGLPDLDWLLEIAEQQGRHLVAEHPLDGQPPTYVLGSWKDRARMETPVRLGMALDGLARRLGDSKLSQRAERVRRLVWSRFQAYSDSVEIQERFLLLGWFVRWPPGAGDAGDVDRSGSRG